MLSKKYRNISIGVNVCDVQIFDQIDFQGSKDNSKWFIIMNSSLLLIKFYIQLAWGQKGVGGVRWDGSW